MYPVLIAVWLLGTSEGIVLRAVPEGAVPCCPWEVNGHSHNLKREYLCCERQTPFKSGELPLLFIRKAKMGP